MKGKECLYCLGLLASILVLAVCSADQHSASIRFPYQWLDEPGYGGNIDQLGIPEPSGICYHPLRKTLFVVSDEGEVAEIQTDGSPVFRQKIPGDLEGISVNPESGFLYIIKEGDDVILEFDPDQKEVTRTFPLNRMYGGDPEYIRKTEGYDNGLESIEFIPDSTHPEGGTFYLGNQWDPPCIMEVLIPLKTCKEKTCEARILRVLPLQLDDPAAMHFDSRSGLLNIVSDADNILVEIDLKGKIIKEYAFLGDGQEGITIDKEGYLYIAQDYGERTAGEIIKVKDLR
ncbi:MAG: SdiA-regulated domain-containing protein [Candidatus Aminicenantes bacterium]|nr:SdiA-regulated domain-containing protein [Candidatus Aminicenantes bacterium]